MLGGNRIRLILTPEQEELCLKSAGAARWAYNYFIEQNAAQYQLYKNGQAANGYISASEIKKQTVAMKKSTHKWLKDVSCNVVKQAINDADKAYSDFISGKRGKPHFKSRRYSKPSFYVNYETLKRVGNGFKGEKLGVVKTAQPLPKLKEGEHYSNPRISYDGKHWYLSFCYPVTPEKQTLTNTVLGIDLGVKTLATCSDKKVYKNINKSKRVRKLKKRLKREQRKLSRKLESNTKCYKQVGGYPVPVYERPLKDCKNIERQRMKVNAIQKKIANIRTNYLHQTTTEIVRTKPSRIVMENLNVKGMLRNRHLAKAIHEACFYEFKRQMIYKCEFYGIEFIEADRFYPSSKKCSNCGNIKHDLKLSDRVYNCVKCGLSIDRDYNASLNLASY